MMKFCVPALAALLLSSAASAQQYYYAGSPPPQQQIVAAPPRSGMGGRMGGGFIEYLFGDQPRGYVPAPQYAPQQQQQGYIAPPSGYPEPGYRQVYANPEPVDPMLEPQRPGFQMDPRFLKQEVAYGGKEAPGTIIIDTPNHFLYLVLPGGRAIRYGVGVGRPGFTWAGMHAVSAKKEWPDWTPPKEMLERQPYLPRHMAGGPNNPLGARAMYLGSTLYRIHGSNEPWTIGQNVSSGCIRMRNADVIDLYERVTVGTKVVVM